MLQYSDDGEENKTLNYTGLSESSVSRFGTFRCILAWVIHCLHHHWRTVNRYKQWCMSSYCPICCRRRRRRRYSSLIIYYIGVVAYTHIECLGKLVNSSKWIMENGKINRRMQLCIVHAIESVSSFMSPIIITTLTLDIGESIIESYANQMNANGISSMATTATTAMSIIEN